MKPVEPFNPQLYNLPELPLLRIRLFRFAHVHGHPDVWRLGVSGGIDGLIQPVRAQLGDFNHAGIELLHVGLASGSEPRNPRYF